MQVQLNTGTHVQGHGSMAAWAQTELSDRLSRYRDHITRIEVHLSDENAGRSGDADKRCTLEARLAGRPPLTVSHDAARVADALQGAADRLRRALDADFGRMRDAGGRATIRGALPS